MPEGSSDILGGYGDIVGIDSFIVESDPDLADRLILAIEAAGHIRHRELNY